MARSLWLEQTLADRPPHQLDAIAHAQLAQDVGPVGLDGLLGQVQDVGDLPVRVRLGDQLDHLALAWGDAAIDSRLRTAQLGLEGTLAGGDAAYRRDELAVGLLLEDV